MAVLQLYGAGRTKKIERTILWNIVTQYATLSSSGQEFKWMEDGVELEN